MYALHNITAVHCQQRGWQESPNTFHVFSMATNQYFSFFSFVHNQYMPCIFCELNGIASNSLLLCCLHWRHCNRFINYVGYICRTREKQVGKYSASSIFSCTTNKKYAHKQHSDLFYTGNRLWYTYIHRCFVLQARKRERFKPLTQEHIFFILLASSCQCECLCVLVNTHYALFSCVSR